MSRPAHRNSSAARPVKINATRKITIRDTAKAVGKCTAIGCRCMSRARRRSSDTGSSKGSNALAGTPQAGHLSLSLPSGMTYPQTLHRTSMAMDPPLRGRIGPMIRQGSGARKGAAALPRLFTHLFAAGLI